MPTHKCKICQNKFYVKPSHVKNGLGIFCSRSCKNKEAQDRKVFNCFVCNKLVYKTLSQIKRSKSSKFFCGKSCQTKWRNIEYSGNRHAGWKGGMSIYRKMMLESETLIKCRICNQKDLRILAVHHIDQDHSNTNLNNFEWLCHNCHYLVHHDKLEKQRFNRSLNL